MNSSTSTIGRKTLGIKDQSFFEKMIVLGNRGTGKSSMIQNLKWQSNKSITSAKKTASIVSSLNSIGKDSININNAIDGIIVCNECKMKVNFEENNLIKDIQGFELSYNKEDIFYCLSYMCQCICILFDNKISFEYAKNTINALNTIVYPNFNIILIRTKIDILSKDDDQVNEEEIESLIKLINDTGTNPEEGRENNKNGANNNKASKITPKLTYIKLSNETKEGLLALKSAIFQAYNNRMIVQEPTAISNALFTNKYSIENTNKQSEKNNKNIIFDPNKPRIKYVKTKAFKRIMAPALDKGIEGYNVFKIILLGDTTVGKTAFFYRFLLNEFTNTFTSTIGINDSSKYIKIYDNTYKIQLWDTAGQERFKSIPKKYYEKADGIILLYDITKEESFNNTVKWIKDIYSAASESLVLYLVGNKADLNEQRKVKYEHGLKLAQDKNMKFVEVSCKWDLNVSDVIYSIVFDMYKINNLEGNNNFSLNHSKITKNNHCC